MVTKRTFWQSGFSLIEVLIAVAIIAVLTSIGIATFTNATRRSRDARRQSDLEQLRSALEMYRSDIGHYPNDNQTGFDEATYLADDLVDDYTPTIPQDPLGTSYQYRSLNVVAGDSFEYCLAADLETLTIADSTCSIALPAGHDYGRKNP